MPYAVIDLTAKDVTAKGAKDARGLNRDDVTAKSAESAKSLGELASSPFGFAVIDLDFGLTRGAGIRYYS